MEEYKFNEGDRVVCVKADDNVEVGETGTVCTGIKYIIVDWDNGNRFAVDKDDIELIKEDKMKTIIEEDGSQWNEVHNDGETRVLKRIKEKPLPVIEVWIDEYGIPVVEFPTGYEKHWPWLSIAARIVVAYPHLNYIAVDEDGLCCGYIGEPNIGANQFYSSDYYEASRLCRIPEKFRAPDWKTTRFEVRHV